MNNNKYKRMIDRLPEEMKALISHINHKCIILAHHPGSMGWSVDFQIKGTNLSLIYDRGSLVVIKEPGKSDKNLYPKDKDMLNIRVEDLANEVNKEFA